ncbi:MAG: PIG-L deacetylase family protein [Candidatus Helarchaeota archaeon]
MEKKIIIFGAHPDDIEIGMGGSICYFIENNFKIYPVIACIPNDVETRRKECIRASEFLKMEKPIFLSINPEDIIFGRKLIESIDRVINKIQPISVFTHWIGDSHQDHINLAKSCIASSRHNNFNLFMYEQTIPGGITTEGFKAQRFINITDYINKKIMAIKIYESQIKKNGEWWIEGLIGRAKYRGYQIKVKYAEAFEVIKIVSDVEK